MQYYLYIYVKKLANRTVTRTTGENNSKKFSLMSFWNIVSFSTIRINWASVWISLWEKSLITTTLERQSVAPLFCLITSEPVTKPRPDDNWKDKNTWKRFVVCEKMRNSTLLQAPNFVRAEHSKQSVSGMIQPLFAPENSNWKFDEAEMLSNHYLTILCSILGVCISRQMNEILASKFFCTP